LVGLVGLAGLIDKVPVNLSRQSGSVATIRATSASRGVRAAG
jgi:hypothetical protein